MAPIHQQNGQYCGTANGSQGAHQPDQCPLALFIYPP